MRLGSRLVRRARAADACRRARPDRQGRGICFVSATWEEAAARRASFENVAALVSLHAERGEIRPAERQYAQSRSLYRGVSPFPLALRDFQMGLMWMDENRLDDARRSFDATRRRVPAYAQAQGHLAEVEAQLGEIESAVASLHSMAASSDDPDYAVQLARILAVAGRDGESRHWRRLAADRYDELLVRRPEAFADHATEFWLAAGADPDKALRLAKMNREVRNTPRARGLLARAVAARVSSSQIGSFVADGHSSACRNDDAAHTPGKASPNHGMHRLQHNLLSHRRLDQCA